MVIFVRVFTIITRHRNTVVCSNAEMSWLRLTAGYSMLKIAEQKGVGDQYTAEQFYTLSQLMYVSSRSQWSPSVHVHLPR